MNVGVVCMTGVRCDCCGAGVVWNCRICADVITCDIMMTFMKQILQRRGVVSAREIREAGVTRFRLARLVAGGAVERLTRGIYLPARGVDLAHLELEVLAQKGTDFVVTLESALQMHGFSNATPHAVWIAMKRGARRPAVDFPLEVLRVHEDALRFGVEKRHFDGMRVNVYSAAKTVADLFKFRTRVGLDVALGALKEGLRRRLFSVDELMCAADVDRVKAVVSPYVEAYFA